MSVKNGVDFYIKGTVRVPIYFPNGEIACKWCHLFLRYEEQYRRYSCRLLPGEWILNPFNGVPANCPLELEGKTDERK